MEISRLILFLLFLMDVSRDGNSVKSKKTTLLGTPKNSQIKPPHIPQQDTKLSRNLNWKWNPHDPNLKKNPQLSPSNLQNDFFGSFSFTANLFAFTSECTTGRFECPDRPPQSKFYFFSYEDPNNCQFYFRCYSDGAYLYDCGTGRYFDGETCRTGPCDSECSPLEQGRKCRKGLFSCPPFSFIGQIYPDPNNCRYYFICDGENIRKQDCGPGFHYSDGECLPGPCPYELPNCPPLGAPRRSCQTGSFDCSAIPAGSKKEDPNDCRYYYECRQDGTYRGDCGPGRHFYRSSCTDGPCPDAIPDCPLLKQARDCKTGYFDCPKNSPYGSFIPDPNDCRYYFLCLGNIEQKDCGPGQHFDSQIKKCSRGECPYKLPNCPPQEPKPPPPPAPTTTQRPCVTGVWECPSRPSSPSSHISFVDPNNCQFYFDCYTDGAYRQDCGLGNHWDGHTCVDGVCPNALLKCPVLEQGRKEKKGPFKCPLTAKLGELFPDHNDCRYYFVCWEERAERRDCGPDKHFSNGCLEGPCPYKLPGSLPQEPSTNPDPPTTSRPCQTGDFTCPNDAFEGSLHPDPNNCRYYFKCSEDGAYKYDCGAGRHLADNGNCRKGNCPKAVPPNCGPLGQSRPCKTGPFECPSVDNSLSRFPDSNNCQFYFECYPNGTVTRKDCGKGSNFGLTVQGCLEGECSYALPDCKPQEVPPPPEIPTTPRPCLSGKFKCPPGQDNSTGVLSYDDPNDCRYYFNCYPDSEHSYLQDCGVGKHRATGTCADGPCPTALSDCPHMDQDRPCKTGTRKCSPECKAGRSFFDDNDCRYYFTCLGQFSASERHDCGPGKHWESGSCVEGPCPFALPSCPPQEPHPLPSCKKDKFTCPEGTTGKSFADPNDCRFYFTCSSDGPYLRDCGEGKHWETNEGTCIDGSCPVALPNCPPLQQGRKCKTEAVKCPPNATIGDTFADSNDCRYYFTCLGKYSASSREDCGSGNHFDEDTKTCVPGSCSYSLPNCPPQEPFPLPNCQTSAFKCTKPVPTSSPWFYSAPDPNDCRFYWQCWRSGPYLFDCGVGRHFTGSNCADGPCPTAIANCPPLPQDRPCHTDSFQCEADAKFGFMQEDHNDCQYYFVCYGEKVERKDCGQGRHFREGQCRDGECSYKLPNCKPQEPISLPPPPPASIVTTTQRPCVTGKFSCPAKYYIYKDPNDCRYYFECLEEGAYRHDCGVGNHWNGYKCVDGVCPNALPDCPLLEQDRKVAVGPFVCPSSGGKLHGDKNDCRYYFVCLGGGKAERKDCGEGKHYKGAKCTGGECPYKLPGSKPQEESSSPEIGTTERPCLTGDFSCPEGSEGTNQVDPNNCRYYYRCEKDGAFRQDCGEGNHFKAEVGQCHNGVCPTALQSCGPMGQRRECKQGKFECPEVGILSPDVNDCRYYFKCYKDGNERQDCGAGNHFDSIEQTCMHGDCSYTLPNCKPQEASPPPPSP